MKNKDYLKDLQDIKSMMAQSSQFLSLSGFSGVIAGIYALIGAFCVNQIIEKENSNKIIVESVAFRNIIIIAFIVLVFSIATAYFLTVRKAKKHLESYFQKTYCQFLYSFGKRRHICNSIIATRLFWRNCPNNTCFLWYGLCKCKQIYNA
jgi:hypothetical protein